MRIVMMGTGPFAVPTLERFLEEGRSVVGLITRPVPPSVGRKKETTIANPMRACAERHGLPVVAPPSANTPEAHAVLREWSPEVLVVCDYGEILSPETLALAPLGGINLHGSLLPKFRGAAPINWAILRGEAETGVSVIHMTPKLDAGPIITLRKTPIGRDETTADLEPRLAQLGIEPVCEALEMLANWDGKCVLGTPQQPDLATSARRLRKTDGRLNWTKTSEQIRNQVRGLKPWPNTFTFWHHANGAPVRLLIDAVTPITEDAASGAPGTAVHADRKRLIVRTGDGVLSIDRLQPAGKRIMEVAEFLHGHAVAPGDLFGDET